MRVARKTAPSRFYQQIPEGHERTAQLTLNGTESTCECMCSNHPNAQFTCASACAPCKPECLHLAPSLHSFLYPCMTRAPRRNNMHDETHTLPLAAPSKPARAKRRRISSLIVVHGRRRTDVIYLIEYTHVVMNVITQAKLAPSPPLTTRAPYLRGTTFSHVKSGSSRPKCP